MINQLKAELSKLLSVRSTYILIGFALVLISLFAYFGTSPAIYDEAVCVETGELIYSDGYTDPRLAESSPEELCGGSVNIETKTNSELPKEKLLFSLQETVPLIATFASVIVILLMAHEFRYNTINYTLTINNSRSKVLASKVIISVVFAIAVTLLAMGVSIAVTQIAINVKGLTLPPQDYNWMYVLLRHFGYVILYVLFGLGIITLVRNLTAGIAAIFVLPTLDGIAGFLLASRNIEPTKILPFSALERFGNVVTDIVPGASIDAAERFGNAALTPATVVGSFVVVSVYLIGLWVLTWTLFLKRDAS